MPRYIAAARVADEPAAAPDSRLFSMRSRSKAADDLPFANLSIHAISNLRSALVGDADIIGEPEAAGHMIVECDEQTAEAKKRELPADVIFEIEKHRWHGGLVHPAFAVMQPLSQPLPAGIGAAIELLVDLPAPPLEGTVATLYLAASRGGFATTSTALTNDRGEVLLAYDPRVWTPVSISVTPRSRAWSGYVAVTRSRIAITLQPLPRIGPLGWWHRSLGVSRPADDLGTGIRVGVIDTGIGPHPYLAHAKSCGAIIDGRLDRSEGATDDISEHGTHVAGIIGARPTAAGDFAGIAPGADLAAIRIYNRSGTPGVESAPANNGDIAQAILRLARDEQCDIINLSSGGPLRSAIELDRIAAAFNAGTLLICAAGNGAGPPVLYPAAEANVIGVSALGVFGAAPAAALDIFSLPAMPDRYNGFGSYLAAFSSFGPEIKCIGPGVGIISTVPMRGEQQPAYLAASGTSMAAPAIAGALAAILSRDPVYKTLPRNRERTMRAWSLLASALRSQALAFPYQGFGLPFVLPSPAP